MSRQEVSEAGSTTRASRRTSPSSSRTLPRATARARTVRFQFITSVVTEAHAHLASRRPLPRPFRCSVPSSSNHLSAHEQLGLPSQSPPPTVYLLFFVRNQRLPAEPRVLATALPGPLGPIRLARRRLPDRGTSIGTSIRPSDVDRAREWRARCEPQESVPVRVARARGGADAPRRRQRRHCQLGSWHSAILMSFGKAQKNSWPLVPLLCPSP